MNYKEKYLKYKSKYENLKKMQFGGDDNIVKYTDKDSIIHAISNNQEDNFVVLKFTSDELKNDRDIILLAIKDNIDNLYYVPDELIENNDFMFLVASIKKINPIYIFDSVKEKHKQRLINDDKIVIRSIMSSDIDMVYEYIKTLELKKYIKYIAQSLENSTDDGDKMKLYNDDINQHHTYDNYDINYFKKIYNDTQNQQYVDLDKETTLSEIN